MSAFLFVCVSCELIKPSFGGLVRVWINAVSQERLRYQVCLLHLIPTVVASFPDSLELGNVASSFVVQKLSSVISAK